MDRLIITLDGPAGSGKSTLARRLAHRLGIEFLDTGAMYRGLTAMALGRGIDLVEEPFYVVELARNCPLTFDWSKDPPALMVRDQDMTPRLRDADVAAGVSEVAKLAGVRDVMVREQQKIGREHPRLVTEGRDQGSIVFPEAAVKFYMDADPQIRAERRAAQLREAGRKVDLAAIRESIVARDAKDRSRAVGPLMIPNDAEVIDTTAMDLADVEDLLHTKVIDRTGSARSAPR